MPPPPPSRKASALAAGAVLASLLGACATLAPSGEDAQATLVSAERAFARYAREHGVHAAFLRHFAPGGLLFVPQPAPVEEVFAKPPVDPLAVLLEWEPVASGVAASGELGFTTGPARVARRDGSGTARHSTFFSVWKRSGGGPWRVVIDAGPRAPQPVPPASLLPPPRVHAAAPGAAASLDALLADERSSPWSRESLLARLAPDALVQRDGTLPLAGRDAAAAAWPALEERLQPIGGDVAASRDLAFTYGAVQSDRGNGHYVHLWTRADDGRAWRIAAAIRLP